MKKKLISSLVISAIALSSSCALAAPAFIQGDGATAPGDNWDGVIIGNEAFSGGSWNVVLGGLSQAGEKGSGGETGVHSSVIVGTSSTIGNNSASTVVVGNNAHVLANTNNGVALGARSNVSVEGGIALGVESSASRAGGKTEVVSFTNNSKSGSAWVSTTGALALGNETQQTTRQITGLAAGSEDSDAVNVAQLRDLKSYSDATFATTGAVNTAVGSISERTVFGTGASTEISPASEGVDAVMAQNATVLGNNGKVQANGAVAIGANSIAASRLDENGAAPTGYLMPSEATNTAVWQADVNHGVVSFGGSYTNEAGESVNFNRQITGVAAGSEDNDAVNVAQLKVVNEKADAANNTVQGLMTGETKVSTIQLTSNPDDASAPTIGLRYEAAQAAPAALADGDPVTPTTSQGRLVYNNLDAAGTVLGTETIATLSDGFMISGNTTASAGAAVDSVKVDLNQGISFLGDDYLQTTVTAGENGGATVTIAATQKLIDSLGLPGDQPVNPDPSNPGTGSSGSTGGNWTPTAAQQAALNGNFSNGITIAAAEGREAITIQQNNVNMGGNRIQNIGDGVAPTDAVNKRQLDNATRSLHNKINDVDKDLRAGIAMAMAVGNLPQAYMPGKSIVAMSAGTYHGQGGFALGLSHAMENRSWIFKGAASVDTRGNFGGTVSAGYQF